MALPGAGGKFDRAHLVESILEPSRQIVEGYRSTILALSDGRVLTGIVREESTDSLILMDAAGQRQQVAKSRIEERRLSDVSLMPDGLADELTPQQFTDLIAFLETLRSGRKPTPGVGCSDLAVGAQPGAVREQSVDEAGAAVPCRVRRKAIRR